MNNLFSRLLFLSIALMSLLTGQAQLTPGSWRQYPVHGTVSSIVETPGNLWYNSGGCLYQYDKKADETRFYANGTDISDYDVKFLRADPEGRFIVVVYTNGNIDLLYPDGTCRNLPEIKETLAQVEKGVNDVRISGNEMFVACPFGLVVYDLGRLEVKESGLYGFGLDAVIISPTHIYIQQTPADTWDRCNIYAIERGKSLRNIASFTPLGDVCNMAILDWAQVDAEANLYARVALSKIVEIFELTPEGEFKAMEWLIDADDELLFTDGLTVSGDGRVLTVDRAKGIVYEVGHYADGHGKVVGRVPVTSGDFRMSALGGNREMWIAQGREISSYKVGDQGELTLLSHREPLENATSFAGISRIFPAADGTGFFIVNRGMNKLDPIDSGDLLGKVLSLNHVSPGSGSGSVAITEIDPHPVSVDTDNGRYFGPQCDYRILSPGHVLQDPDNPSRLYIASATEGLYVIEDGEEAVKFDNTNSPLRTMSGFYGVSGLSIDTQGNLWVTKRATASQACVMMLPRDKRRQASLKGIAESDWVVAPYGNVINSFNTQLLHFSSGKMTVGISFGSTIQFIDHAGTPGNLDDDSQVFFTKFTDQDGKSFAPKFIYSIAEDKRGQLWIGTSTGVITVSNPARAFDSDFYVNRVKVPRNDGTNLADYLLDTDAVTCIAVDNSNRKWLGTENSGLFLVSENGDQVLASYNSSNSLLPTNTITALYADPGSNSIFIATPVGLFEFSSTSAPARPDFSDVYAYPNPVTPDYHGWITITGLMESSLVKIVDSSMKLVYQTISEGGMARWDGCTMSGDRVRSGVYYVMASSSADSDSLSGGGTAAVACKIMVVN